MVPSDALQLEHGGRHLRAKGLLIRERGRVYRTFQAALEAHQPGRRGAQGSTLAFQPVLNGSIDLKPRPGAEPCFGSIEPLGGQAQGQHGHALRVVVAGAADTVFLQDTDRDSSVPLHQKPLFSGEHVCSVHRISVLAKI